MALAGTRGGKPFLHSHMTAVLPECQNRGVGRQLKLFQRVDALKNGVPLAGTYCSAGNLPGGNDSTAVEILAEVHRDHVGESSARMFPVPPRRIAAR